MRYPSLVLSCLLFSGCVNGVLTPKPETKEPEFRIFVPETADSHETNRAGYLTGYYWSQDAAQSVIDRYPENSQIVRILQPQVHQ